MSTSIKLTVLFEDPFWIGIFERVYEDRYEVSRVVFGSEPKDYEIYDFIIKNFRKIVFSNLILSESNVKKKISPKRLQRKIKNEVKNNGIGTKAQIAIKLQQEENKIERKKKSKKMKEEEKIKKFQLKKQKKKEKQKGH
ncbi:hypothetical protein BD780_003448 [Clostridium tetanomorphum]|uniref:YjdF family protein n=1 Tax=Clostridium tetanomorphum TaxID=1553 RepID=A0A923EBV9_CLOTT|nr:YjdF family protein [Clostridium tetanomorphum]KAJ51300.1 hypothetical protein CTM_13588 [Clostridium tetanomorphum DSM 665]MBC2397550.1 YjdF family protein [Clostridium tetanomorphum]MBP1863647.1 hypothetical protein [Clostridium tetanomorphum]NRS86223.1 hypothetical protein [Clostridium tetanomorphum]NRZ95698.1 hypothetical protein [Clostridium tetanomorphum]